MPSGKRPTHLRKLKINEVSLVDSPASIGAEVVLWKRHVEGEPGEDIEKMTGPQGAKWARGWATKLADADQADMPDLMAEMMAEAKAAMKPGAMKKGAGADAVAEAEAQEHARREMDHWMEAMWRSQSTLREAVENIIRDDAVTDKKAAIAEAMEVVMARIKDHGSGGVAAGGVEKGAGSPPALSISGAAGDGSGKGHSMTTGTVDHAARVAELEAALAKAEADKTAAEEKLTKATEQVDLAKREAGEVAELKKRLDGAEERLESVSKAHAEAVEKAERLEFEQLVEKDYPSVPGTTAEKAEELRTIHKMADGPVKERLLKRWKQDQATYSSLTQEIGKGGTGKVGGAMEELLQKANALRAADPKLSMAQAMDRAEVEVPNFQKRYLEEAA